MNRRGFLGSILAAPAIPYVPAPKGEWVTRIIGYDYASDIGDYTAWESYGPYDCVVKGLAHE